MSTNFKVGDRVRLVRVDEIKHKGRTGTIVNIDDEQNGEYAIGILKDVRNPDGSPAPLVEGHGWFFMRFELVDDGNVDAPEPEGEPEQETAGLSQNALRELGNLVNHLDSTYSTKVTVKVEDRNGYLLGTIRQDEVGDYRFFGGE